MIYFIIFRTLNISPFHGSVTSTCRASQKYTETVHFAHLSFETNGAYIYGVFRNTITAAADVYSIFQHTLVVRHHATRVYVQEEFVADRGLVVASGG